MSDIQRYQPFPYDRWMQTSVGNFVTYEDHVAALRACEQRVREDDNRALWDQRQFNAGVQAARDAAEIALLGTLQSTRDRVLAAIDNIKENP